MLEKQSASNLSEIKFNFSDYQKTNRFLQAINYKKSYISKNAAQNLLSAKTDKAMLLKSSLYLLGALALCPLTISLLHMGKSEIILENDMLSMLLACLDSYSVYQSIKLLKQYKKRKQVRHSLI